jgi:serine/threonine-protein kinase
LAARLQSLTAWCVGLLHRSLYVADSANNVVRKISPSGIITTIAGNGTAGYSGDGGKATAATLSFIEGIALGADGR